MSLLWTTAVREVMSWDDVVAQHPEMAEHEDAVHTLAHATEADPYAEGDTEAGTDGASVHDLTFEHRNVPLDKVRSAPRDPHYYRDERYMRPARGYSDQLMDRTTQEHGVPPVLLVRRNGAYHVADGHHRAAMAKGNYNRTHINAVVATSPLRTPMPRSTD